MKTRMLLVSALVLMMSAVGYCIFRGDCNGDGVCDDLDFLEVINNFGKDYRITYPGPMIYIPPGPFLMGNSGVGNDAVYGPSYPNEFPQHVVNLAGYWIGKYEVTRGEYQQFMDANGYTNSSYWSTEGWNWRVANHRTQPSYWAASQNWGSGSFTQTGSHPVVGVTYYEAEAFCNWAGGHLPTEAQWEKAARWDAEKLHSNVHPWNDRWDANRCNNWDDTWYVGSQTAPVGSYSNPSPYGCQDMAGNVWEWCKEWYGESYYSSSPTNDPPGPSSGSSRVLRGGSWGDYIDYNARTAFRGVVNPYGSWYTGGFRLSR